MHPKTLLKLVYSWLQACSVAPSNLRQFPCCMVLVLQARQGFHSVQAWSSSFSPGSGAATGFVGPPVGQPCVCLRVL